MRIDAVGEGQAIEVMRAVPSSDTEEAVTFQLPMPLKHENFGELLRRARGR